MGLIYRALLIAGLLTMPVMAAAETIFSEDFDDGVADGFTPIGPGWAVEDGVYTCETFGFEVYSSSVFGDPEWLDIIASFDIKSVDATSHIFRFRVNDFEDFYDVNLRSAPWNDVVLMRTMNTQREIIAQVPTAPFANNTWHNVQVMAEGFHFTVVLNGTVVLEYYDGVEPYRLRGGQCAVVCYSGGVVEHQVISYDNVVITMPTVVAEAVSWSNVKSLYR